MTFRELLSRFSNSRKIADGFMVSCPAHPDKNPSLHISEKGGKLLLFCHAGCDTGDILAKVGLKKADLFFEQANREPEAIYPYTDAKGKLLFEVLRYPGKQFNQRRPDGKGGHIWNLQGVTRVLYNLPEVLKAKSVLIVEGEKDVDSARALGLTATCNPHGAGKWRDEYAESLNGKRIAILPDGDGPGREHAEQVVVSLYRKAEIVKVVELPDAKDLSEWIARGGTKETLFDIIKSAPEWKPRNVNLCAVLASTVTYIRRYVSMTESQALVVALWVAHTHAFEAADTTPYLAVNSAEKQSGKTKTLEVCEPIVHNPWMTGRVTAGVLTRKIDRECPTLLLDESDAAFAGEKEYSEALRGILNTGHHRGGKASCCTGQGANISYRDFSTFCPKAIAGIGKLPDTVADRSIPIRLKRQASSERVEKFRRREVESDASRLRNEFKTWAVQSIEALRDARPSLPDELSDRQQDGAEPLLAIADMAGREWPEKARKALIELGGYARAADDSVGVKLLADIKQTFEALNVDRIPSKSLVDNLVGIETSPWAEWFHGKPITMNRVAKLLRPFEVRPDTVRVDSETTYKGYMKEWFEDAFRRYVPTPPSQKVTASQANVHAGADDFSKGNKNSAVTFQKCEIPNKNAGCDGVTIPSGGYGEIGVETPSSEGKPAMREFEL